MEDTPVQALTAQIHVLVQALPEETQGLALLLALPVEVHGLTLLFKPYLQRFSE